MKLDCLFESHCWRLFKLLLGSYGSEPRKIVTDKLRSYGVAHRERMPAVIHSFKQYENNRAEHYCDLKMSAFADWNRAAI